MTTKEIFPSALQLFDIIISQGLTCLLITSASSALKTSYDNARNKYIHIHVSRVKSINGLQ